MPAISKIRFTNVVYENGAKRYNDEIFDFDGHNGAMLLENGGGKTVFIQTAMQAIIPHIDMAERKIKDTLSLENAPAHIAIEWILTDKPRRYALTACSLFMENNQLNSLKYTYDYSAGDSNDIENLPFAKDQESGAKRPATRGEISDYYSRMNKQSMNAKVFTTIQDYGKYIENTYKIIPSEWRKVALINSGEGNVDEFFNKCKTTQQLLNNLLIPVVEEAIEGDNTAKFVETFERQRDHFKKNRVLQDKIEQSQLVKEQIDSYVEVFSKYEEERIAYEDVKREAKTVANYVNNQMDHNIEQMNFVESATVALSRDYDTYNQKVLSYEFLQKTQDLKHLQESYNSVNEQIQEKESARAKFAQRKQNIEVSLIATDVKVTKEQLALIDREFLAIDEDINIVDIKSQLDENASWIKGHYTYELELIEREHDRLSKELVEVDESYDEIKEQYSIAVKYEKEIIAKKSQLLAKVDLLQNEVDRMEEGLFEDEEIKAPSLLIERIDEKISDQKADLLQHEKSLMDLSKEEALIAQAIENNEKALGIKQQNLMTNRSSLEQVMVHQDKLKSLLEKSGYHLYLTGDFYSRQESLLSELEEQREVIYNKKERALTDERKHFNLLDIYGEKDQFNQEPLLSEFVDYLKDKTSFIATGVSHLSTVREAMDLEDIDLFKSYPYWGMTLVCSVVDEKLVRDYIEEQSEALTSMVAVVTIEALNQRIKAMLNDQELNEGLEGIMVYPKIWLKNLSNEKFSQWQESLSNEAMIYQDQRKVLESQLGDASRLLEVARSYFEEYSYESYKSLMGECSDDEKALDQFKGDHRQHIQDLGDVQRLISDTEKLGAKVKDELEGLKEVLALARELQDKDQQLVKVELELKDMESSSIEANHNINELTNQMEVIIEARQKIVEDLNKYQREEDRIVDLEIFGQVAKFEPTGTTTSIEVLRQERSNLEKQLSGVGGNRTELNHRQEQSLSLLKKYEQDYARKVKEAQYEVFELDVYYENEVDKLYDTIIELDHSIKALSKTLRAKEKAITENETRCQILKEKCESDYYGIYQFEVQIAHIDNKLKIEKATLKDRERKLKKEKAQIEGYIGHLRAVEQELLIKDGAYSFLLESIQPIRLSVDYYEDFDKNPEGVVSMLMKGLDGQHKSLKSAYAEVTSKQEEVMDYCKDQINDLRLRDSVIKGIYHKNDYKELLIYQEKMTEIIMKIIQVAEDDKRESDIELQTFLSHLLAYIKNVSSELDMIQTKTRIEMEDSVKQIFVFDIPEWEEDVAKGLLRTYIDETIEYYEKESLHQELDELVLRRNVEERLGVKNLLQVVMGEQSIKIKCRKVTNDMKINKAPMAWESSNKWSGGEKWSKNMTLFLSILNYLAEKKQHLSAYQKRQRSVILDNPFGKASSDHVLRPVFMIADKLGFQIIALTAHAEGKFISEYFPVVYSCRLRATKDRRKQLMTNERSLNYAYLKENSPMTIMRMQEVEQLNLFD